MIVISNELILPGKLVLCRDGKPVFVGTIGDPIEDVDFDKIQVNPADYERIKNRTSNRTSEGA